MTTTLTAFVTWGPPGNFETPLKEYLGVTSPVTADNNNLERFLRAAAEMGDTFIGQELSDPPPENTILGCFEYVKALWNWSKRDVAVKAVKTASLAETYVDPGTIAAAQRAFAAARPFWDPWKKDPTLAGMI